MWGVSRADAGSLLDDWEKSLLSVEDFNSAAAAAGLDFNAERLALNAADVSIAHLTGKGRSFVALFKRTNNDAIKVLFLLGLTVRRLRSGALQLSWFACADALGWSEAHLRRADEFYDFLSAYPRFLRATVPYTTILKQVKKFISLFKASGTVAAHWRSFED